MRTFKADLRPLYHSQFFKTDLEAVGHTDLVTMDIETGDSPPILQKPYNLSLKHTAWVQKELKTLGRARDYCSKCFSLDQSHCGCPQMNSTWGTPTEKVMCGLLSIGKFVTTHNKSTFQG